MPILLVRHPEPDIEPGRCYGRLDIGLSRAGQDRLAPLAATLRATGIDRVLTSPARRCRALANALTPHACVDARLQELDFGAWEGRRWDDIERRQIDAWAADPILFAPPGGESGADLIRRIEAVCADLRAGPACIVIAHGGPLRLMLALLQGRPPDLVAPSPPFGSVTTLHHGTHASADSTAHSTTTAHPPSTSPVKPPI